MKIAIIRLSAMGDILHMLWCIKSIKEAYSNDRIDFFVDERFYFLVEGLVWFDNVYKLPFKKSPLKAIQELKKYKNNYDISIDYQGRLKSALIAKTLSKNSFGYAKNGLKNKMAYYFYKNHCDCDYLENVYKRSEELSKFALPKCKDFNASDVLIYNEEKSKLYEEKIKELLKDDDFILLHNGSSKVSKMYPLDDFIKICQNTQNKFYLSWGNDYELERASKIANKCPNAVVLPKLSLSELVFLTKRARLVIGNDSGTTHIAVLVNVPNITILNENAKKPAKRFVKESECRYYFPRFADAKPEKICEIIKKVMNE